MSKPTLLYASPFLPKASGISDYSSVLVNALAEKFDITLFSDDYDIEDPALQAFPVLRYGRDTVDFNSFDHLLYNMGNNADYHSYIYESALQHPGVVIEHDLVLFHFIFGYYKEQKDTYFSSLYSKFGVEDFTRIKRAVKNGKLGDIHLASSLPLNEELLSSGNRFIVHSGYTRGKILETKLVSPENIQKINHVELVRENEPFLPRHDLLQKFHVPEDALLICAFGYIQQTKLNRETCRAVKALAAECGKKLCFVMVGAGDYADEELEDGLILKTGYTEIEEFNSFIRYADLIVNLRYPSMGETSGAMLRILQMGKCCITNDGGWFSEIPAECVYKIDPLNAETSLKKALTELISQERLRQTIAENAARFTARECAPSVVAEKMYKFITQNDRC